MVNAIVSLTIYSKMPPSSSSSCEAEAAGEFRLLTTHASACFAASGENFYYYLTGLLEGDGTITVDKQKNSLRVRIIISLLNSKENFEMLALIKEIIGGRIIIERKDKYVT